ncbi:NAD-dependent epimerase/dehydratase family protein [Paenibacillus sp. FSL R10-2734]|uniref:NAD-dependent epimerase/dehydratase family protein n=1 Tax=Paenibacillus sp. FSL R10-2734 TaxID=2954691 RepID=UPI0030DA6FA3
MKGQRLLITGAAGFTGRHAVHLFLAGGAEVTAVVRPQSGVQASTLFPEGVKIYHCDLSNRQDVAEMIKETVPEAVLHLAGNNSVPESWRNPLLFMETNVMATLYLLEAMRSLPTSRILVAGSRLKFKPGVVAGPPHPYSLSKTIEELVSLAWGTLFKQPVLLAEPCNLIGPGPSTGFCSLLAQHVVRSEVYAGEEIPPFKLSSRYALRDFLDVRDAVRAYDFILREGTNGIIYRIDSGTQRQLGVIAEQLISRSVASVPMEWGPEQANLSILENGVASDKLVVSDASATPEVDVTSLGWKPKIEFSQSLTDILDYCRVNWEGRMI